MNKYTQTTLNGKGNPKILQTLHKTVNGRRRYKIKGLLQSPALKHHLEMRLSSEKGVSYVRANPATGNLLLLYQVEDCNPQEISREIETLVLEFQKQPRRYSHQDYNGNGKSASIVPSQQWHHQDIETILPELSTSIQTGLTPELVEHNSQQYGANVISQAKPRSGLSIFIDYFKSAPVALLSLAAGLSIATGGIADAAVIMGVVTINAVLGYMTESQSERIINSLQNLVNPSAWVIRDGNITQLHAAEIVVGDILILKPGCYIPADARLIEADNLTLDESALTGESVPVLKSADTLYHGEIPLAERINMVYRGTFVTGGQGQAVIVATGKNTEMGKIQSLVGETLNPQTPLEKQLQKAGGQLVLASSGVCGLIFGLGLLRGYGVVEMLKNSISLAVAAVPEGLPTIATTTLALGIRNMRKQKVLIRRLNAVEALGSIQTICLDKTGTLTENQMSVVEIYTDSTTVTVDQGQFWQAEKSFDPYSCDQLLSLLQVVVLCNDSEITRQKNLEYVLKGSSTENALIHAAIAAGIDVEELRYRYPRLDTSHRSQFRNIMTTIHSCDESKQWLAVKGNPTEVLNYCSWKEKDGQRLPLTEEDRTSIKWQNEQLAGKALRVLGVAYCYTDKSVKINGNGNGNGNGNIHHDLVWLGLIGMIDPIRNGVKTLIGQFHQAGIETVMITGDQRSTAYAIGKELNLSEAKQLDIIDSTELDSKDPQKIRELCDHVHVFARISPAHKLQVVQTLQQTGKVVAMTGDGINDTPALKAAEVGVVMGNTGTDAAREVADVILEDDNLETMIVAISQGRTTYNNIRKSLHFLLATNLSEMIVMLLASVAGLGHPINAMQLLWLNLVTDIFPGLALAQEPPEPDVLQVPPRPASEPILKKSDLGRITLESTVLSVSTFGAYSYALARHGAGQRSSTIAFMSLVGGQLFHALSCRSEKPLRTQHLPPNPYLNLALGGSFAIQFLPLVFPGLGNLLKVVPIDVLDGLVIGGTAILPLAINEGTKPIGHLPARVEDEAIEVEKQDNCNN
ncbi:ATPase, P-type (transporting), HAD superfamily, subfamily IC [Gloeothece citriformis PCC 7424]|uniref:ATPase, P-type (Transporting), HAD superfamily, subfamily IC n=1 Tax=Gloeothece citriformis (strain PCC 7424) TaxID=65393 RepID=B7KCP1_GLOC7|nr:HAD-IC family P-type ATPase [Gloeothece citriformis]ACK71592.1 ATPase, P-type (transporting), HAD superfamily, subfamily IC [Gloeothece citriformis PCC 7424]